jgi:hypothetical protein
MRHAELKMCCLNIHAKAKWRKNEGRIELCSQHAKVCRSSCKKLIIAFDT